MKNRANVLGLITVLLVVLSTYLKIYHLPGSSLGLVLSLGLLFPIYFIINIISIVNDNKYNVFVFLSCIFFLIFEIGLLFITMHWPMGGIIFRFGFVLAFIALLVTYFIESKKKEEANKLPAVFIIVSIVIVSMIYIASFRGIARNIIDGYIVSNENFNNTKEVMSKLNEGLISKLDTSVKILDIHKRSNDLINIIESLKQKIAKIANDNKDVSDYSQIKYKQNFDIPNELLIAQGKSKQLKDSLNNLRKILISSIADVKTKTEVSKLLDTQDPPVNEGYVESWETKQFEHLPVISAIATLTGIQVNILTSEFIVIQKLKNQN